MIEPQNLLTACKIIFGSALTLLFISSWGVAHFSSQVLESTNGRLKELQNAQMLLQAENAVLLHHVDSLGFPSGPSVELLTTSAEPNPFDDEETQARYDFSGSRQISDLSADAVINGEEAAIYEELKNLEKEERYPEMIEMATLQIIKTPDWLTPYLFRGAAYFNLGQKNKAADDFEYVAFQARSDPNFAIASRILEQIRADS